MGRVNRLIERRALRRAADQALLTSLGNSAPGQPGGAPDQDFEYTRPEPAAPVGYDHQPVTAPIPVEAVGVAAPDSIVDDFPSDEYGWVAHDRPPAESVEAQPEPADVYDLVPDQPDDPECNDAGEAPAAEVAVTDLLHDYGWYEREELPPLAPARPLRARPLAEAAFVPPALDFAMSESQPWYRSKPAAAAIVAAAIAAIVCGGWLVFRSPTTTAEQATVQAPTSTPPAPSTVSTAAGAPNPAPALPPPPPPPPPPAEPTYTPPQRQYQPRYTEPSPAQKPRVDVTRAPMSVAPVPKPVPGSDSNTPGDAPGEKPRRRGCFGFC